LFLAAQANLAEHGKRDIGCRVFLLGQECQQGNAKLYAGYSDAQLLTFSIVMEENWH
jgi:hypothetical protein